MGDRKALLIGAEEYGDGFSHLQAAKSDVELIRTALKNAGYEVEVCSKAITSNASDLDKTIRRFCTTGGPDDIRIMYFSGHGLLTDNIDCIIPEKASRKEAIHSPNQRVSTDLSLSVRDATIGLVIFIIDACRDRADVPTLKGAGEWGDPARLAMPSEHRFVRLFGCAADQVCQVLQETEWGTSTSLFTRALVDSLQDSACTSLDKLLTQAQERVDALLRQNPLLKPQTLRISQGELSAQSNHVRQRPVFDRTNAAVTNLLEQVWTAFDPNKLHCLVVLSEYEHKRQGARGWRGLRSLVRSALSGETGEKIWTAFRSACDGQRLVSGSRRDLGTTFSSRVISYASFSVLDALASDNSFAQAVRVVVEADLVVFDVTEFEPAVMLLLGARSACRRSLNVCSHGAGWMEGQPLEIPFNLQDLNIGSHTPMEVFAGPDPRLDQFTNRIVTGFDQIAKQPHYLDLPGYDSLRELGSEYSASSTIRVRDRILVLCPYKKELHPNWIRVQSTLKDVLWNRPKGISPKIERIIDYGTPQLIYQSLYEQIRRTEACIADLSDYNASVFLELGVRLAVNKSGTVQIIDERYLPGAGNSPELHQIELLQRILSPISYRVDDDDALIFEKIADQLLERTQPSSDFAGVHGKLLPVIGSVQTSYPSVAVDLKRQADALHHPDQAREGAPQILFSASRAVKDDSERAALELRIAAWLYLDHRMTALGLERDPSTQSLYQELGRSTAGALYDLGDLDLAEYIERKTSERGG